MSVLIYGWKEIHYTRVVPSMVDKNNLQIYTEQMFCNGRIIYGLPYKLINNKYTLSDIDKDLVDSAFVNYNFKYDIEDKAVLELSPSMKISNLEVDLKNQSKLRMPVRPSESFKFMLAMALL